MAGNLKIFVWQFEDKFLHFENISLIIWKQNCLTMWKYLYDNIEHICLIIWTYLSDNIENICLLIWKYLSMGFNIPHRLQLPSLSPRPNPNDEMKIFPCNTLKMYLIFISWALWEILKFPNFSKSRRQSLEPRRIKLEDPLWGIKNAPNSGFDNSAKFI